MVKLIFEDCQVCPNTYTGEFGAVEADEGTGHDFHRAVTENLPEAFDSADREKLYGSLALTSDYDDDEGPALNISLDYINSKLGQQNLLMVTIAGTQQIDALRQYCEGVLAQAARYGLKH